MLSKSIWGRLECSGAGVFEQCTVAAVGVEERRARNLAVVELNTDLSGVLHNCHRFHGH